MEDDGQMDTTTLQHELPTIVDLGSGNKGNIGPARLGIDDIGKITIELSCQEYRRKASKAYDCVDGRNRNEVRRENVNELGLVQVPGGKPIQDSSIRLMRVRKDSKLPGNRLSRVLAEQTRIAVDEGYEIFVHGDDSHGKDGCAANKLQRDILISNAKNANIVLPLVWDLSTKFGLNIWIDQGDISDLIVVGNDNAHDDDLWDATPSEKADIIVDNGGKYVEVIGEHTEVVAAAVIDANEAINSKDFADKHVMPDGTNLGALVATLGRSIADIFKNTNTEEDKKEAALNAAASLLWTIGTLKEIGDDSMKIVLIDSLR